MIERSLQEGVLTLRLAHGKASALDVELLDALLREFDAAGEDVRAVILTGTASIFCPGVDLFRLTRDGADYVQQFLPLLSRVVRNLFTFPRPVVAAVNGHAIAGGCVIALACDARLMADGSGKIGVPELLVGLPFSAAAMEIVRFAVPREKLQALIYTGRTLSAREALAAGLVDELATPRCSAEPGHGACPATGGDPAGGVSQVQAGPASGGPGADRPGQSASASGGAGRVVVTPDARANP
jgi:enoyl-CoA hydratase